ncbi:zinc finger, CCCH type domain-containing protein [Cryptosporidium muris RN66]|uniref:Zinc finger, CCCH type domain-containing protein n=1 Tax=Cryptosporidium muris (strain RN66) TaxID=441375 RepID=B6AFD4_CRYMR|nr:zinc finger, CCCH type domain-containing protein [Cryptosporidium muris RN66]EEA06925.1 zinc finger, CCCH type domain-containing protein [Cryptosporidium muris RN66]|eukprot:XP_002141274.1 zinc finger, CCCH type domain-containing protein [Cryptosporidium muris RN66]
MTSHLNSNSKELSLDNFSKDNYFGTHGDGLMDEAYNDLNEDNKLTENIIHDQFWKTKLCLMHSKGTCKRGVDCRFAHGYEELRSPVNLKKTKLCPFWLNSSCTMGITCPYAHGTTELRVTTDFYKTSVCRYWKMGVKCDAGILCRHAHGEVELRPKAGRYINKKKDDTSSYLNPKMTYSNSYGMLAERNTLYIQSSSLHSLNEPLFNDSKLYPEANVCSHSNKMYTLSDNESTANPNEYNHKSGIKGTRMKHAMSMHCVRGWDLDFNGVKEEFINKDNFKNDLFVKPILKPEESIQKFFSNSNLDDINKLDDTHSNSFVNSNTVVTGASSYNSLKRMEGSSNSLVSNISDLSIHDDLIFNNWQLKYPPKKSLISEISHPNIDKTTTLDGTFIDSSSEIETFHLIEDKTEPNIQQVQLMGQKKHNCLENSLSSSVSETWDFSTPTLVEIKKLNPTETPSMKSGSIAAILLPSDNQKSATVHFLSNSRSLI